MEMTSIKHSQFSQQILSFGVDCSRNVGVSKFPKKRNKTAEPILPDRVGYFGYRVGSVFKPKFYSASGSDFSGEITYRNQPKNRTFTPSDPLTH